MITILRRSIWAGSALPTRLLCTVPAQPTELVWLWIRHFVMPLKLCPWASAALPYTRVVLCHDARPGSIQRAARAELRRMRDAPAQHANTLLALCHPSMYDVATFATVLQRTQAALQSQCHIAKFHPDPAGAGMQADALPVLDSPAQWALVAPCPILHLLPHAALAPLKQAAADSHRASAALQANERRLAALTHAKLAGMYQAALQHSDNGACARTHAYT